MFNPVWKQKHKALIIFLLLAVAANPLALAEKEIKWEKSIENGLKEAQKTGKPIIMDFYADW
jgi:thiol:disulfide interchange protein